MKASVFLTLKLILVVLSMSSCMIFDTYTANKFTKFPSNLTSDQFVKTVDSINAFNYINGYIRPIVPPNDFQKIRSLRNLGLYRVYLFNAVYREEKADSIQFYLNQISGIHKKYITSNDVSRRMSGIGPIVYSKFSLYEKMRDSVNSVMLKLDKLSKVNFNRNYYFLYKYVQRKKPLYALRDKHIFDGKMFYTSNPTNRFRLNVNALELAGTNKGMGIGASIEPQYKWTNNSSFGLKVGYTTFYKNSSDYSFYSQQHSSLIFTYNFIPYGNSDILSGTSNFFSIGGGMVYTKLSGIDDRFYFNNLTSWSERSEDKLFNGVLPMFVLRDGIQSRFFRFGVEFNLIPSIGFMTNEGNYDRLLNTYWSLTYGLVIGSRKWK